MTIHGGGLGVVQLDPAGCGHSLNIPKPTQEQIVGELSGKLCRLQDMAVLFELFREHKQAWKL
jgi:hypothetical protein